MPRKKKKRNRQGPQLPQILIKISKIASGIVLFLSIVAISLALYVYKVTAKEFLFERVFVSYVIEAENLVILDILNINTKNLTRISIPSEYKTEAAFGYGNYKLAALPKLGIQEGLGLQLIQHSISKWLGAPILAAFELESSSDIYSLRKMLQANTTLDFDQKIWLVTQLQRISSSNTETVDLLSDNYLSSELEFSESLFEQFKDTYIFSPEIASYSHQIIVVNATGYSGLALTSAEKLRDQGYDVVGVQDGREKLTDTVILANSDTVLSPVYIKPIEKQFLETQVIYKDDVLTSYRGDLVILLGEDYLKYLYGTK